MLHYVREKKDLLPHGKLRCTSSNGTDQFFIDGKYVSKKNQELIKKVAQREYYEYLLPVLEERIKELHKMEKLFQEDIIYGGYSQLCQARKKLVEPVKMPIEQKIERFMAEKYEPGYFNEDDSTEYYTIKGERVRSKSEKIIADELYRYEVPYHYEKPLILRNKGKRIKLRPDFTTINRMSGKIVIYEHLGMMDNPEYVDKNINKLDLYEKNGYLLGKNLIITHETSSKPLSVGVVDSYIENFLI